MPIFLTKFIPLFFYPLGIVILLLLGSVILARRDRLVRTILLGCILILWLAGSRWVAFGLTRTLEWQYLPPAEIPSMEVAVVLGGGTEPADPPRIMAEINSAGDRVLAAYKVYRDKKVQKLLLSGGNIMWQNSSVPTPADGMHDLLALFGVPEDALWNEEQSRNTAENAKYSAALLRSKGIDEVLLITSAIHMPRAAEAFRREGVTVIPLPVDYTVTKPAWDALFEPRWETQIINLMPNVSNLSLTTRGMKEVLGAIYANVQSYLPMHIPEESATLLPGQS